MYKIRHGLLDFPRDAVFVAPPALGFEVILSRFTNSGVRLVVANMRSAFESSLLDQAAREDCERFIRVDIQVSTGYPVAVPLPRSSPLIRHPIFPPKFVPPCRIPPLCYYSNYAWSSIVDFTAHWTIKRDLICVNVSAL